MELKLSMSAKHARIEVKQDNEKTPRVALNAKGAVVVNVVEGVLIQEVRNFVVSENKKAQKKQDPPKKQEEKV